MPYSTACCTPLSNFEVQQNYKEVVDPAGMQKFIFKSPYYMAKIGNKYSYYPVFSDRQLSNALQAWSVILSLDYDALDTSE